jgi:D-alanyl-lipoteichoic acid acyltransferase DltB (MBOAT superfamily)
MLFSSAEFLFFFLLVLGLHRVLPWRRALLLVASYGFYASWNPPFVLLLAWTSVLDYTLGRRLEEEQDPWRRRALLAVSLAGNLGVLVYFKYVNFFLDVIAQAGLASPATVAPFHVRAAIPLGLSFYTFQSLSYTIDVYRRDIKACRSLADFFLFVSFFPHLVAGPVLRADQLIPQIRADRPADAAEVLLGLELCLIGLFQKVVVADNLALLVDACYARPEAYAGGALLLAALAFNGQIYCDFAGYSTMARGLASLLGFALPENFAYPLLASSPVEFRRRWHITMGNWFRDYVYRPLGGDRGGPARTAFNTLVTWGLFGLWHGASWTFLAWGMYQGVILAGYRLAKGAGVLRGESRWRTVAGYLLMPVTICISGIYFRSPSVATANTVIGRITSLAPGEGISWLWPVVLVALYVVHWGFYLQYREGVLVRARWVGRMAVIGATMAVIALFAGSGEPFYYFQF